MYQQREIGHFVKDLLHLHSFQDTTYYSVKSRKIFLKYQKEHNEISNLHSYVYSHTFIPTSVSLTCQMHFPMVVTSRTPDELIFAVNPIVLPHDTLGQKIISLCLVISQNILEYLVPIAASGANCSWVFHGLAVVADPCGLPCGRLKAPSLPFFAACRV